MIDKIYKLSVIKQKQNLQYDYN